MFVNYGRLGVATDIYSASPEYVLPLDSEVQAAVLPDLKGLLVIDQYAEMLGLSSKDLELKKTKWNDKGDLHLNYQQVYEGFPVYLTSVSVHFFKDGSLQGISANTVPIDILEKLDLSLLIKEKELQSLINANHDKVSEESYEFQRAEQIIYVPALNPESDADVYENYLIWNVTATDSHGRPWSIFVDAKTGAVLNETRVMAAIGAHNQKICESDTADGCGYGPAYKGIWLNGIWYTNGNGCNGDIHCEAAKENLADVFEYYQNNLGRNNFSGNLDDVVLLMYDDYNANVCYLEYTGTNWQHNIFIQSAAVLSFTESIETIAHEFTHGISWYELGWEQTGIAMVVAMAESNADVMGILIGNQGNWDFADDYYYIYPDFTTPIRILDNPNFDGSWNPLRSDMATYCSPEVNKAHPEKWEMYTPMLDNYVAAHFNSTIFSKVFQLYVGGGTYNGMSLVGVGETIARDVWYKALTESYWQVSQDAQQWAYRAVQACQNEYGNTSIYCTRLLRAAAAVGIAPLPRTTSANAAATPHPVSFDNKLWIFWRDASTNEIKYKTTSSSIGSLTTPTWSSITSMGKYSTTSPTPIVYNGRLMLFWTRTSNLGIRYVYNDGSSWSSEYSPAGASSASSEKIAAAIRSLSGDCLYIVYRDNLTTAIKYRAMNWPAGYSHSTLLWGTESALSNAYTSYAPAVTAYNDDLLVLFKNSTYNDVMRTFISGSVSPQKVQEMYSKDNLTVHGDLVGWAHNSRQYFFGRRAYVIGSPDSNMGFVSTAVGGGISSNWYAYVDLGSATASTNAPGVTTHQGWMVITTANSAGNINYMFMR